MFKNIKKNKDKKFHDINRKRRGFKRIRGMKDILFDEYRYWDLVVNKAGNLAKTYSFKQISTPLLENLELYKRSSGKSSDIVNKEMYSFIDKNGEKLAIRPEATPGMARAYIEHGMFNLPQPIKMFWLGPLLRHEKPQSGRLRQHTQFDLEIFGEASPVADFMLILIAFNFFRELQINVHIQINSIGCRECRKEYISRLLEFYRERGKRSKLCPDCKKRIIKNPLRLLDCKEEKCIELRAEAPQIVDFLCDECRNHFIKVLEYLDELDIPYNLNSFLVRGLDYYTKTVFEILPAEDDSSRQSSLGGGGRFDELVENLGGRPTPACGFGIGLERVILKIKEKNIPLKRDEENYVFIAQLGDQSRRKAIGLFEELRRGGINVRQSFTKDSLKAQLEEANRLGAKFTLILGQKEMIDGTILIRDMESGIQEVIDYKKIKNEIEKKLNGITNH
ncbi:histidine--tRNA ligase [Candidatus Falkowbacteria bacterium CG_4_10_14_0_2_um_filter_36_22]|uniref:Histidine--tRNA ligase n=1 Tax=Candidatus Falkowbacteria bacterium CG02_land_8_20_14_3_00_36_14 TaxID=1974560 RepID=A0A2M7DQ54_9BACT|nr:MAG: histidine--tRNA ligase [Candidatus Falkowbacteria bacterium CG02_land_8_20_14_3_00_36_14]PIX11519.1 MAG: histidine--tRNA ligase [Candidatus Falkowbacteria bacterium CG_4_8_14_3_um_filter_36_11]PJA10277.1 MAG: histidine--tRNA ligase [Candidatus Falkowbacteria bacterium CG_4_10_14_0_2_um_filter_36_22]